MLVGVWAPTRWDLSLAALSQYTTPPVPPASPWVERGKGASTMTTTTSTASTITTSTMTATEGEEPRVVSKQKRPASRRIMRHVLRARGEAVRALAGFFTALEDAGGEKRVVACAHLARRFGCVEDTVGVEENEEKEVQGYRYAREVVAFLRLRGAKIATLEREIEGGWAGLGSEEEGTPVGSEAGDLAEATDADADADAGKGQGEGRGEEDDMVWVPATVTATSEAHPKVEA